jgi:hypothetical protein
MAFSTQHALTKAHYEAIGPNEVRVTDGASWGLFDRYGGWIEGEIRQADPQLCIWLTGLYIVQARTSAQQPSAATSPQGASA